MWQFRSLRFQVGMKMSICPTYFIHDSYFARLSDTATFWDTVLSLHIVIKWLSTEYFFMGKTIEL